MHPHEAHRKIAARNMAMELVAKTGAVMPRFSYRNVVREAIVFARQADPTQWLTIGQLAGHYVGAKKVDPETIAEVLRALDSLVPAPVEPTPAPVERDPFDFSRGVLG